ncbi:MAG: helix-turn-helix transcriptional regulator [Roseburia inulinivorans]|nr:helix-turn-helix transcriptional regulator [Roseburia inulinivorans]
MGLDIGRLLYGIRTKYQISVNDICRGICGVSTYCMYENDEIIPDILSVNMFLDRMGFGTLGVSAYISKKEAVYFKWKESTRACIRNENYKKLEMLLEYMPTGNVSLNKKIREQYAWFVKGIVAEKDTADLKKATECYEKALECTCDFLIKSQNYVEEQQKVKIYPLLVCLWGNLVIEGKNTEGSFEIFEKTLELLRKQKSLYCLLEIMRLHILAGLKEKRDMSKEQEDIRILQSFFDEFGCGSQIHIYEPQIEEIMTEFVGHYLTIERKKINYTQEKLSEGICSVESYSRIENGRKPSRKNYKALAEKIGVENRYYVELLNTGKIEALLLRREISRILFSEKSMDKVRESLEKLMEILGEDECAQNKQYLKFIEICIEKEYSHMSEEICCEEYRKVLAYSMNENLIGEKKHIYTKVEINLINHISVCLAKSGKKEQAMRLIRAFLEDTDQMKEDKYHETKLAKLNYGRWLSDSGEYSKADSIFMDGAKQIMERDRAELLDQYIGEIAYNKYLMNGSEKNEQIKRYSLYALVLSKLFGTDRIYKNSFNFFEKIKDE